MRRTQWLMFGCAAMWGSGCFLGKSSTRRQPELIPVTPSCVTCSASAPNNTQPIAPAPTAECPRPAPGHDPHHPHFSAIERRALLAQPIDLPQLNMLLERESNDATVDAWLAAHPKVALALRSHLGACARPFEAPLHINNYQLVSRDGEGASGGLSLPEGVAWNANCLSVVDEEGHDLPTQAHALGLRHSDDSLNYVLVQTTLPRIAAARREGPYYHDTPNTLASSGLATNVTPERVRLRLRVSGDGRHCSERASSALSVHDDNGVIRLDTGPLKATFDTRHVQLPNTLTVNDVPILERFLHKLDTQHFALSRAMQDCLREANSDEPQLQQFGLGIGSAFSPSALQAEECRGITAFAESDDAASTDVFFGPMVATIEESGPVRAVIKLERLTRDGRQPLREGDVGVVVRIYAYANARSLRFELTLVSHDVLTLRKSGNPGLVPATRLLKEHSLAYAMAFAPNEISYGYFGDGSEPVVGIGDSAEDSVAVNAGENSRLRMRVPKLDGAQTERFLSQLYVGNDVNETIHQSRAGTSALAPGWVSASQEGRSLTLASKNFWQTFPKTVGYRANAKQVYFAPWPADAESHAVLAGGRARTTEWAISVNQDPRRTSASVRAPLRLEPDPEYASRTELDYPFVAAGDASFDSYQAFLHQHDYQATLPNLLYSDADYGDTYGDAVQPPWAGHSLATHASLSDTYNLRWVNSSMPFNNYHAAALQPLLYSRAAETPHAFLVGEAMAMHSLDRDTGNYSPPDSGTWAWPLGGRELKGGRPLDHLSLFSSAPNIYQWYQDLAYYYLRTGHGRVRDLFLAMVNDRSLASRIGPYNSTLAGRHHTLMASSALSVWTVVGDRDASHDSAELAYLRERIRSQVEDLYLHVDLDALPPDWSGNRAVEGRYELSGFTTTYLAEMFWKFASAFDEQWAETATQQAAAYFYRLYSLPSGALRYSLNPTSAGPQEWTRGDYILGSGQMYSPGALAYLAQNDLGALRSSLGVADWMLSYKKRGALAGADEVWLGSILFALRAEGQSESTLHTPVTAPGFRGEMSEALLQTEAWVRDSSSFRAGPFGSEVAGKSGFYLAGSSVVGDYVGIESMRCWLAAEALRGWINLRDKRQASRWHQEANELLGLQPYGYGGCSAADAAAMLELWRALDAMPDVAATP